ncbi:MAG TPA: glycosyltransferase family 39 protein [Acidobacteriaceae bacterium]|nr:glycosyltransferase family 39 protein [Acidobacteriaceae bacterium]
MTQNRTENPAALRDSSHLAALLILLLTAAVALAWSHVKLLSQDEIFVLQTDSVSSVRELIHIQRHYPISLDPLVFHLLGHACAKLFGPSALALRLPSIAGFLLMQACIFFATRRIASPRAALIAMAFPALTASLFYAPEARPYGLLLGFYALAFLAWQSAARRGEKRAGALILLAAVIALTLNTHYFGILILIPLCLAELTRTLQRRRLDIPVVAAIVIGIAGIVFALPFQKAAGEFRKHYYNAGAINWRAISQAYRSLFVNYTTQPIRIQRLEDVLLVAFAAAIIVLAVRRLRTLALPRPELVFLLALAALPLFGVALAVFVTHSIEVRYVLSAIIAIAIFFAIAVEPSVRRLPMPIVVSVLIIAILLAGSVRVRGERTKSSEKLALLGVPSALKAQILALPDSHIYIQDMGHFEVASYYEPDPEIRSRLTLLYSQPDELRYDLHDTASLTAEHMQDFTGFTIVPYARLKETPGEHVILLYHSGWDWTDQALAADSAHVNPLGPALDGDAVAVRF